VLTTMRVRRSRAYVQAVEPSVRVEEKVKHSRVWGGHVVLSQFTKVVVHNKIRLLVMRAKA